jgi:ribosomal protein S18 acetylase RimI-like enzyme
VPIIFQDASEIEFEYYDRVPDKSISLRIKNEHAYKLNLTALHLYGLYRNTVHDSYAEKSDLAKDILERPSVYEDPTHSKSPLYHYSVACSLGTMKEWKESDGKIKCYIAYKNINGHRTKIGFVHFTQQTVNDKSVIYIAEAGVLNRGHGVGRHLMECVLAHFPANTEFYILTRIFNTNAKTLYQQKLGFTPISENEIEQLGYDNRYCGFNHITTQEEITAIQSKQLEMDTTIDTAIRY